ncbi:hypothetical protein DFP72DRAFT_1080705 [Ephemerocybe angulata]|uniref:F-box domain-containing protein n=1 Tax=Ephemerocybe angulata TaxID=980116 RepID=A0A8H6HB27_9AGAR|nr:hypothetical protein DFP72DRAFT_1080705 [Tulosesus angulatus]
MNTLEDDLTAMVPRSPCNLSNPPQRGGIDAVEEFHQMVDSRIYDLECEIRALKTRRNAATFTCRLPAELLSRIFLALSHISSQSMKDPVHKRVDWLICTFVCSRWRDVALGCAELWTTPVFAVPALAETMLARSKDAPLRIRFNGKVEQPSEALFTSLSQLARLLSVELVEVTTGSSQIQEMLSSWTGRAPLLTTLHLHNATTQATTHTLPIDFLQGGTPSLKILLLSMWGNTWENLPIRPTITYLVIAANPTNHPRRPTQGAFVSCIKRLPFLEVLNLNQTLPDRDSAVVVTSDCLHLPKLRALSLGDSVVGMNIFFRLLHVPDRTKVVLHFTIAGDIDMLEETLKNTKIFATKEDGSFKSPRKSVRSLMLHTGSTMKVDLWSHDRRLISPTVAPDLCLNFYGDFRHPNRPLFRLLSHFDLKSLQTVHVNSFGNMGKNQWRMSLGQLPNLEAVVIEEGPLQEWLEVLRYDPPTGSQGNWTEDEERHFPGLINMTFWAMDLGKEKGETLRLLVQVLKERTTTSPSFKMDVLFYKCPDPNNSYEKLKQATEGLNVNWSFFP